MKILKIKKVGNSKYQLTLENQDVVTTYEDLLLKYGILYHKEVTEDELEQLLKETSTSDVYYKSVKKITTKLMSVHDYKKWLKQYHLKKEEEEQLIKRLKEVGLLNDQVYANAYVSDQSRLSKYGKWKIEQGLKEHGIGKLEQEKALQEIDELWMYEKLQQMVFKKVEQNHRYSNQQLKQKLVSEFISLGYEKADILECLSHVRWKEDTALLEKELEKVVMRAKRKHQGRELMAYVKNKLYQKGFSLEQINVCIEKNNSFFE